MDVRVLGNISLTISFLVPFPASFVIIIITVFVITSMTRKLIMKNTGINIKGMFSSTSSKPYRYLHMCSSESNNENTNANSQLQTVMVCPSEEKCALSILE